MLEKSKNSTIFANEMGNKQEIISALRGYKARNAQQYGIESLGLFGSFARDEQKESSDVDVFVSVTKPTLQTICTIHDELETLLQRKVDLIRLRPNLNKMLLSDIKRDGIFA